MFCLIGRPDILTELGDGEFQSFFVSTIKEAFVSVYFCTRRQYDSLPRELTNYYDDLDVKDVDAQTDTADAICFINCDFSRMYFVQQPFDKSVFLDALFRCFRFRLPYIGGVVAHGAVVVVNGEGIMFSGFSGAGKSTQANLWRDYAHAEILNYDKPAIVQNDRTYFVCGTPWSGKEECFINKRVPLRIIVFVKQDTCDEVVQLTVQEKYTLLLYNYMVEKLSDETYSRYVDSIRSMATEMDIITLRCTKTSNAVRTLAQYLYGEQFLTERLFNTVYRQKAGFMLKQIADEWILIPRGSLSKEYSATILLNDTGAFMWNCLEQLTDEDTLVNAIMKEYLVNKETAMTDVRRFLADMVSTGIVEKVSE